MASASFSQHLVAKYLQNGGYERHRRKLRKALQHNTHEMMHAIQGYFPQGTQVTLPQGGGLLWVRLPEYVDMNLLTQEAIKRKISIVPGELFSMTHNFKNYIRFTSWINVDLKVTNSIKTLQLIKSQSK